MASKGLQPSRPSRRSKGAKGTGASSGAAGPSGSRPAGPGSGTQRVIPEAVANRMARRIAVATGIPTLMGMGVFIVSYLLVSRQLVVIPPGATLVGSGACFLLGVIGLSYGVLSASWEEQPGSLLGGEQIGLNLGRLRASIRAMRAGG